MPSCSQCYTFAAEKSRNTTPTLKGILSWLHYRDANLWALCQNLFSHQLRLGHLKMDLMSIELFFLTWPVLASYSYGKRVRILRNG